MEKVGENILKITFQKDHDVTVEDIKGITVIRQRLIGDNFYCSIIDVRHDFLTFTKEAQQFVAENPMINHYRKAEALLVRNFGQKLGVEMYIRLFKPKSISKAFNDEQKAIEWLQKRYEELVMT